MRASSFSLASVACLFCAAAGAAVLGNIDKIRTTDKQLQREATTAILDQRLQTIQGLVSTIQDPEMRNRNPDGVAAAIRLLGELRASEAAQPLANMITFTEPGVRLPSGTSSPEDLRPAVPALVEIGIPAVPAVLDATAAGKGDYDDLYLAAAVLTRIVGKRAALGYVSSHAKFGASSRQLKLLALARMIESHDWVDPYDPVTYEPQK
jgi:hypothetical protein